ncbi:gliding motility-associated C-terminal domain-containing protein [Flavobacterium caeni]|uniref:gliding motility-associated C-terminal domain-containing protein n=1 Tax=Flavobacterium caeni TaxID=490189 RepID=UPI001FCDA7CA|nr:gliding motility-associated C-terminal domain-containing protein [Flavobacterium caeni]
MKTKLQNLLFIVGLLVSGVAGAQEVTLYEQFNGRYDFVFFGNTLNPHENGSGFPCQTLTQASAALNLAPTDVIAKAYLYWAGSGTGDFNVKLNGIDITPDRTFSHLSNTAGLKYFSAFKDVTQQIIDTGNGDYLLSELDVSEFLVPGSTYCGNATNFAGWAIVVVYENPALPINQLNVYDGLQGVPNQLTITLDNLNVIDNEGAKIGFVAWEGDRLIANNETLRINGILVGNPPLNPTNNAFNGTNSFTNSNTLYNMDLDVYDIQGYIDIGDVSAEIRLTSGQDVVMINTVVTKLNSQLPDATIAIDNIQLPCESREITVDYTVYNVDCTNELPAPARIAVFVDDFYLASTQTTGEIPIGGSESGQITLTIPDIIPDPFELRFSVDNDGNGNGGIVELEESNNDFVTTVAFPVVPEYHALPEVLACNEGLGAGTYNFSGHRDLVVTDPAHGVSFHETLADAQSGQNPILNTENYTATASPTEVFVRIEGPTCYAITSFLLRTRNCPPTVYNYISANEDGYNDDFFIDGLRDIFLNFKLSVYNRWGQLVWMGNNNMPNWTGNNNQGFIPLDGRTPDGTYFYILELNDPDYPAPLKGYLYYKK